MFNLCVINAGLLSFSERLWRETRTDYFIYMIRSRLRILVKLLYDQHFPLFSNLENKPYSETSCEQYLGQI